MSETLLESELNQPKDSNENQNNIENEIKADESNITEQINDSNSTATESAVSTDPAPVAAAPAEESNSENKAGENTQTTEKNKVREVNPKVEAVYLELEKAKENNETIDVVVKERIRGGLRVIYKDVQLFLPTSHFNLKRSPSEQSLKEAEGKTITVLIHEIQEDETKRKTVIVSRKKILEENYWNSIKVGEKIEGQITSIAPFGIFVDVYGVEGLVHISRISNTHIADLNNNFKKGQIVKAIIIEVNKKDKRLGLSTKEFEKSAWTGISEEIKPGMIIKGTVKRIAEYGAYVEVKPQVEGLVRTNELSWTLRISDPTEILNVNDEKDFYVISINEENKNLNLSLKQAQENPWTSLEEKYPLKTPVTGVVKFLVPKGVILNVNNEIDGFLPFTRMKLAEGETPNLKPGDEIPVVIFNIDVEKHSLILLPPLEPRNNDKPKERPKRDFKNRPPREKEEKSVPIAVESEEFTILDLLTDDMKQNLLKG